MTLDEAIKHAEEVTMQYEKICNTELKVGLPNIYYDKDKSMKCAEEHRQLAEWLKELKQLKEQTDGDLITEIDKLPRIKVGNSNSPTVKYCIDEVLLYDLLERYKAEKTATWVALDDYPSEDWECDNCGFVITGVEEPYRYCPNCGKKMWK